MIYWLAGATMLISVVVILAVIADRVDRENARRWPRPRSG